MHNSKLLIAQVTQAIYSMGSTCFVYMHELHVPVASILLKTIMASRLTGRPKASPVWDCFDYCEKDESVCYLCDNDNESEHCRVKVKGKNPTNLKQHLMRHHKNEYQQIIEKEEEKRSHKEKLTSSGKSRRKQLELTGMLKTVPLSRDGHRYKAITMKLVSSLLQQMFHIH